MSFNCQKNGNTRQKHSVFSRQQNRHRFPSVSIASIGKSAGKFERKFEERETSYQKSQAKTLAPTAKEGQKGLDVTDTSSFSDL